MQIGESSRIRQICLSDYLQGERELQSAKKKSIKTRIALHFFIKWRFYPIHTQFILYFGGNVQHFD